MLAFNSVCYSLSSGCGSCFHFRLKQWLVFLGSSGQAALCPSPLPFLKQISGLSLLALLELNLVPLPELSVLSCRIAFSLS